MGKRYYPPLKELDLELTYRCPRSCVYCVQNGLLKVLYGSVSKAKAKELTTEEIYSVLRQASRLKAEWVNFSGGEPMLRSDLIDMVAKASKLGLKTGLVTKAVLDREMVSMLKSAGLTRLGVSLDSHIPAVANKFVRDSGYFKGCLNNIELAKEAGLKVMLLPVVSSVNLKQFPKYLRFAEKLGVDLVRPQPYQVQAAMGRSYKRDISERQLMELCLEDRGSAMASIMSLDSPVLEKEEKASRRSRKGSAVPKLLARCSLGRGKLLIRPDGKVYFCGLLMDLVVGDVRKQTLGKIWKGGKVRDVFFPKRKMFKGTPCYGCDHFKTCTAIGRCVYNSKRSYGRLFAPDPWLCEQFLCEQGGGKG